ncbi:MAG: hypothetical protein HY078_13010 [Elusimicrobia bacterium]|nr:hypothetical protein [Elusimicrobiota bacterium]
MMNKVQFSALLALAAFAPSLASAAKFSCEFKKATGDGAEAQEVSIKKWEVPSEAITDKWLEIANEFPEKSPGFKVYIKVLRYGGIYVDRSIAASGFESLASGTLKDGLTTDHVFITPDGWRYSITCWTE